MKAIATLTERVNPKTGEKEWALVSKSKDSKGHHRVLKYFGKRKPSEEKVKEEEKRIQYFKSQGAVMNLSKLKIGQSLVVASSSKFNSVKKDIANLKNLEEADEMGDYIGQLGPDGQEEISEKEELELMKLLQKKAETLK